MPKAPSDRSAAVAGPSRPLKTTKTIAKTKELVRKNGHARGNGKGKEKEVFGRVEQMIRDVKLPDALTVEKFAEARGLEILAFQNAIKAAASSSNTRAFQSLPRHLRRRAASHNPKRVPKRLRSKAAAEIDPGDNTAKLHRKKAKLRAKPRKGLSRTDQLLLRQRDKTWLPTHIWHSKRFHMINLWGYRLPLSPTLKAFRPSYRAARYRSIVGDVSYFGIIELEGSRDRLVEMLGLTLGASFAGEEYESGTRIVESSMYVPGKWPSGLIGPVEILWYPPEEGKDRRIWMRVHPSIFTEVWEALKIASSLLASSSNASMEVEIAIQDLRSEIDGFEIMGPRAGKVLSRILKLCKSEPLVKRQFMDCLRAMSSSAEMQEGMVCGLQVYDPRLSFPPAKVSESPQPVIQNGVHLPTASPPSVDLAQSDLWDANLRDHLSKPRFKKSDLDRRRQQIGLPGTRLRPLADDARIPVLLIQKSIRSPSSPGEAIDGFTLLLPQGWSQYFLASFVYANARIGGLDERRVQHREAGVPCFPEQFGGVCEASGKWEASKAADEEVRWSRKPPAKRAAWDVLGTRWPFRPDWNEICRLGDALEEEELVNMSNLHMSPWLIPSHLSSFLPHLVANPAESLLKLLNSFRLQRHMPQLDSSLAEDFLRSALVHVRVEVLDRGSPGDMAIIYSLSSAARSEWLGALREEEQLGRVTWDGMAGEGKSATQKLGEERPDNADVIGFTSTGNFSLSRGRGYALATVTLRGYLQLLAVASASEEGGSGEAIVKIRNRNGLLCRLAKLVPV